MYTHTHTHACSQANTATGKFSSLGVRYSSAPGGLSILQLQQLLKSIAATFHGSLCGLTMTEFRPRNEEVPTESEAMKGQYRKHGWAFPKDALILVERERSPNWPPFEFGEAFFLTQLLLTNSSSALESLVPFWRGAAPQPNPGKSFGIWGFKPPCAGVDVKCVESGWQWWGTRS